MATLDLAAEIDTGLPLDMLEWQFEQRGWQAHRHGDEELVSDVTGGWCNYEVRALWREDEQVLQFIAVADIRVPDDKRGAIYETIGRINEQLWMGHFELWSADGAILFRHAVLLGGGDDAELSLAQADELVDAALTECERFYPVFQFVLMAGKSPVEALEAAMLDVAGEA